MSSRDNEAPVVLYVSDDKAYLNTVRRNLGQAGFSVVTTHSVADAIELTGEAVFDAVLSDYDLLQSDAIALLTELKKKYGEQTPPTLVISNLEAEPVKNQCVAVGASGLHSKSQSMELLVERVTSILRSEIKRERVTRISARRRFQGGTDPLTQVATKEHFIRRLKGESMAAYRDQSHLALLLVIVDHFEKSLELHGRAKSDGVLAQIARLIEGELRSRDCVARYADSTFAVVLPDTTLQAAAAVARRLRRRMSATEYGDLEEPISMSVSIGATCRPSGTQMSPDELIAQATRSASAAQKMGGNRVLADNALTGCPLILVVGDPTGETGAVARGLEQCNVEVRLATSLAEAREVLEEVPVAMVMVEAAIPGSRDGVDLLVWLRNRFPSVQRVLIADYVDRELMLKAINRAAIQCFIPVPWNLADIPNLVDELLFS